MVQASTSRRLTLEVFRSCEVSSWTNINPNLEKKAGQMENNLYFCICFGEVCKLALNHCKSSEDSWIKLSLVPNYWWLQYVLKPGSIPFHTREPLQFSNWCRSISQSAKIALLLEGWHVGKGTLRRMDFWTPRHVLWSNNKCQTTVVAIAVIWNPLKRHESMNNRSKSCMCTQLQPGVSNHAVTLMWWPQLAIPRTSPSTLRLHLKGVEWKHTVLMNPWDSLGANRQTPNCCS